MPSLHRTPDDEPALGGLSVSRRYARTTSRVTDFPLTSAKLLGVPKKRRRGEPATRPSKQVTLELFALRYLANGRNATLAYMDTHPRVKRTTAAAEGSKLLRNPKVEAIVHREVEAQRARLRMEADEALIGISNLGRSDIRRLYDEQGNILPIKLWPDDVADCVKAVQPTPTGWKLVLYDKLKARELMAIAGGKLRNQHDHKHTFDHAKYLGAEPPAGDDT